MSMFTQSVHLSSALYWLLSVLIFCGPQILSHILDSTPAVFFRRGKHKFMFFLNQCTGSHQISSSWLWTHAVLYLLSPFCSSLLWLPQIDWTEGEKLYCRSPVPVTRLRTLGYSLRCNAVFIVLIALSVLEGDRPLNRVEEQGMGAIIMSRYLTTM